MPDIDFQKIKLNLIPKKGDDPVVFYASQYETARPFKAALFWGESEFAPGVDYYAEIDIRKNDDNLVVITDDVAIDNNEVSVILPVQALTCIGKNLGQVKIYEADNQLIAALNFILEVQADPLAGGVTSETAIDNLTQQIEDIAQEVIGDDYYNKTETDALLENKANISDIPDMSNYYTKAQTYSSSQIDTALSYKADASVLSDYALKEWVELNFVDAAYLSTHYYNKNAVDNLLFNMLPVGSATGNPCTFDTEYPYLIQRLKSEIVCGGGGGTPSTPIPIVGHSELNLDVNGNTFTVAFGQTVYGGVLDVTTGKLSVNHVKTILDENVVITRGAYGMIFKCSLLTGAKASVESVLSGTLSDKLSEVKQTDTWGSDYTFSRIQNSPTEIYFNLNSSITTIEDCVTFLESNPIEFVYELATPIVIDVPSISVFAEHGTNNITSDCIGDVNVSYKDTIQHYIDTRL